MSREDVSAELGRLAQDDSRYKTLQAAIVDGKIFYMAQAGNDLPSYSWASELNRNLNYSLSEARIPAAKGATQIELAITRSERVSLSEALETATLIRDVSDALEAKTSADALTCLRSLA